MSCEEFRELMSSYIDGYIEEDEKIEFENHLKSCKHCREEFEQFNSIINEVKNLPEKKLPNHYHEDLMLKLYKSKDENKLNRKNIYLNWKVVTPLVASFILLIFTIGNLDNIYMKNQYFADKATKEEITESNPAESMDMAEFNAQLAKEETTNIATEDGIDSKLKYSIDVDRKIIYNNHMYMEVENFDKTIDKVKSMANNSGGYVENSSSYIYYSEPEREIYLKQGTIVIRIPVERYGEIQEQLISLGHLINQEESSTNVTEEYIETESRIRMLEVEQDRLLEIMEKADKVEDLIKLEERLNKVRTDLEIHKSKIKNWDQLVSLSTFTIELKEVKEKEELKDPDPNLGTKIKSSFIRSLNDLRKEFEGIMVQIAYLIMPFTIFIIILIIAFLITKPLIKLLFQKFKSRKDE